MTKIPLKLLGEQLHSTKYALILGLGFDHRCLEVLRNFCPEKIFSVIGISNAGWNVSNQENIAKFREITGAKGTVCGENSSNILKVIDNVQRSIAKIIDDENQPIAIDITAMSHELLAVLLGLLNNLKVLHRVTLLYIGASEYSYNSKGDDIWLSRGVQDIRSILGFPGSMLPSKKLHLLVMAGFEAERASQAIMRYEPASISIGRGRREHSVSEEHYNNNRIFFNKLNKFVQEQKLYNENVFQFEFSCVDPWQTKKELLEHLGQLPDLEQKNVVVCPLNTKLSTAGAVFAALERPEIQLCYLEPVEYNTQGYAKAGPDVSIIKIDQNILPAY